MEFLMKRIYLFFLLINLTAITGYAQKAVKNTLEIIQLKENGFDFGKIPQGRPVTHDFEIVNKSKAAVIIENVEASCGCTSPEWSQEPVTPGGTSIIKVGFNAASEGRFLKTITIHYNGDQVKMFTISGEVYPTPTTSAPLNTSLSKLKQ
jgi:hypothetical protein